RGGCQAMALRFGRAPCERKKLTRNLLPAAGGRESTDLYGIAMKAYQTWAARSMRADARKPEFQTQPSSWRGVSRAISRSIHSPCGETSNSLYLRMLVKSEPMNTSATSHFQSSLVSISLRGSGLRLRFS